MTPEDRQNCAECGHHISLHFVSDTQWCGANRVGHPESEYCKCAGWVTP